MVSRVDRRPAAPVQYTAVQRGRQDCTCPPRYRPCRSIVHAHDLSHARVWDLGARWAARCPPPPTHPRISRFVARRGLPRSNLMVPCYDTDLSYFFLTPMIRTACLPRFYSMSLDVAPVPSHDFAPANRSPAECLSWERPKLSPLNHFVGIDRPLEVFLKSGNCGLAHRGASRLHQMDPLSLRALPFNTLLPGHPIPPTDRLSQIFKQPLSLSLVLPLGDLASISLHPGSPY